MAFLGTCSLEAHRCRTAISSFVLLVPGAHCQWLIGGVGGTEGVGIGLVMGEEGRGAF
jgi:hypothetical protein